MTPDPDEVDPSESAATSAASRDPAKTARRQSARAPIGGRCPRPRPFGPTRPGQALGAGRDRRKSRGSSDPATAGSAKPLAPGPNWWERILFGRVSSGQLAQFCRQFASYLHAGVDYNRTFSSLEKQFAGTALGPAIGRMRQAHQGAARRSKRRWPASRRSSAPMFLSMIRVAEARGGVPETLRMMGNHYEARQRLIRQARSAMIYPVIVLIIAGGVVALITICPAPDVRRRCSRTSAGKAQLPWPAAPCWRSATSSGWVGWWLMPAGHDRHRRSCSSGSTRRPRARP